MSRVSDRVAGLLLCAAAVWYGLTAEQYTAGFSDPLGPAAFPQLLSVPLGLLSLYLLLRPDTDPTWPGLRAAARQGAAVAVLAAYALALEPFGFLAATTVGGALLARLLGAAWLQGLGVGAGLAAGLFAVFDLVLGLPLPLGTIYTGG